MRQRNMRLVYTGAGMIVLGIGFFLFMMTVAHKSNDPVSMMRTVGQVSGVVCGIALAMIIFGFIGKKTT